MKSKPVGTMDELLHSLKVFPSREIALAEARKTINQYHSDNPGQRSVFVALLSNGDGVRAVLNPGDVRSRIQLDAIASRFHYATEYVPEKDVPGGKAAG